MTSIPVPRLQTRSFSARYVMLISGEVLSKGCLLLAFAYLARLLGPRDFGLVELSLGVTVFFVLGVESGMGLYGARIIAATPARLATLVPQVVALRLVLAVPAYVVMVWLSMRYASPGLGLLAVNGLAVFVSPFLMQWVFQGLSQMQWVAAGSALRNVAFAALVFALVREGTDVRVVALAEVASIMALALFSLFVYRIRLRVRPDLSGLGAGVRQVFSEVWSLGLSDFMWACLWYAPGVITGWMGLSQTEHVAWIAAAVRIVMALHTFVWLYFFNLMPNLARELAADVAGWRRLILRSTDTAMWPAALIAIGGTLIAPLLIPAIYGEAYRSAVLPFQIVIWMIPVAWFSGHFRFSLIAAGHQRWEFAAAAVTAVVTVGASIVLVYVNGSVGAASALLIGGIVNAALTLVAMNRQIDDVAVFSVVTPVVLATVASLAVGGALWTSAGPFVAALVACTVYTAIGVYRHQDLIRAALR